LLNARLRELISQYADNVLDRDLARRVADLMARSPEAEAYLAQLQRLRPIVAGLSHARAKWLEHVLAAMEHNDSLALCFAGGDGVAQLNT